MFFHPSIDKRCRSQAAGQVERAKQVRRSQVSVSLGDFMRRI